MLKQVASQGPPKALRNQMQTHASVDAEKNKGNNAEAIHEIEQTQASLRQVQELTSNRA